MFKKLFTKLKWFKKRLKWDLNYRKGKWDYMGDEKLRYAAIVELIRQTGIEKPKILDLGCGYGALNRYLQPDDYGFSLGIDLSSNAIARAKAEKYPNAQFQVADIHQFVPKQQFDIIIFNEVLYYLDDQLEVVSRFSQYFEPGGCFIFSFFNIRQDLIDALEQQYSLVRKEIISQTDGVTWGISLYRAR